MSKLATLQKCRREGLKRSFHGAQQYCHTRQGVRMHTRKSSWKKVSGVFLAVLEMMIEVKVQNVSCINLIKQDEIKERSIAVAANKDRMEARDGCGRGPNGEVIFLVCIAETCLFWIVHFHIRIHLVVRARTHTHTHTHTLSS